VPTFDLSIILPPSELRTVDAEEDDDSRTEDNVRPSISSSPRIVTGGLLLVGLDCLVRNVLFEVTVVAGEKDDMDVGVEAMLNGPGDPEYPVEGVVDSAYRGVGGAKSIVAVVDGK
jgi:hypothetical protein